jgi:hypothetical protein
MEFLGLEEKEGKTIGFKTKKTGTTICGIVFDV